MKRLAEVYEYGKAHLTILFLLIISGIVILLRIRNSKISDLSYQLDEQRHDINIKLKADAVNKAAINYNNALDKWKEWKKKYDKDYPGNDDPNTAA